MQKYVVSSIFWLKFASTNFRESLSYDFPSTKVRNFHQNSRNSQNLILTKIDTLKVACEFCSND